MKCSSLGCLDSIQLLLDHHANVLLQDMEGNTAAHYAAFDNRREAYILLLHNGYDESIVNKENKDRSRLCTLPCFLQTNMKRSQ